MGPTMTDKPLVVIVGPPGAGKTTIGELLAARLDVAFRDNDADIEAGAGKPIREIFVVDGEQVFRAAEAAAIRRTLSGFGGVFALGGGAVLDPATRELLRGHRVLYLRVGFAAALRRVGVATSRPVLTVNPRVMLRELLAERTPLYEEVATMTLDTDNLSPEEIAAQAAQQLEVLR